MIRFEHVVKRYPPGGDALTDVSFTIGRGDLAIVAGHSGAGKSTLLKLISAIERPTSGTVLVNGQNVGALKRQALPYLRRNLGIVFQDQKLLFDRSVFDNVMLPLALAGFPGTESTRRVRAALDKVGLLPRERAMPVALSGGEQQKLALARAVVNRPNLLLADEPTAHLDAATAADVVGILREFHNVGVTILIATYDASLFADCMTQRLTLQQGRLLS
jgi:cell division transport system ATP-binding protein